MSNKVDVTSRWHCFWTLCYGRISMSLCKPNVALNFSDTGTNIP